MGDLSCYIPAMILLSFCTYLNVLLWFAFGVRNVVSEEEEILFREFPVGIQGVYYRVSIVCLGPNDCTPKAKRLYGQGQNEDIS